MATIDRQELDRLERRGLQLTILSAVFVLILASGLAVFMYPLVFVHLEGNKWTLRVAFFGFCALTLLFLSYLFDRQRAFHKLKDQLLAELERNVVLQIQASADLLQSMPDQNFFWDRLSMEFRRAQTMEKNLSLVVVRVKRGAQGERRSKCGVECSRKDHVQEAAAGRLHLPALGRNVWNRATGNRHTERQTRGATVTGRTTRRASALQLLF